MHDSHQNLRRTITSENLSGSDTMPLPYYSAKKCLIVVRIMLGITESILQLLFNTTGYTKRIDIDRKIQSDGIAVDISSVSHRISPD